MTVLEVENLKVSYSNHTALENINLKVNEGDYVCLVGENGSGKSTLVKTIVGLLKPDEGNVFLNISLNEVAYLSQMNLKDLDFPATAKEIIMSGTQKHGKFPFYTQNDRRLYARIIKQLKIEELQNKRIGDLSGGQKQRILIARALIREPKLLILDEPATGLDYNITKELYKILENQNKENKMTIIMATHDLDELNEIKPRIVYLAKTVKYDGKIEDWKGF